MSKRVPYNFNPDIFHPLYFIRKGLFKAIQERAPLLKGKMMDFGCGSKPYQSLFTNLDEYIGVDFHNEGHPHQNEQIDVFYDGKTIPFSENTFDAVLASEVFEHIFNLEDMVKELNRVLKPGGDILITVPFVWNEHEVPYDFGRYTSFGIKDLLERNNFQVVSIEKTTTFIQTITQIRLLYLSTHVVPKIPFITKVPFLWRIGQVWYAWMNIWGSIKNAILPKRNDLYLNLVILAKKNNQ